ncbi:MAG TPA: histidine phosphatase family protein [Acidimicrobiales bacterium]|nr:histidine phosphatase family protein [Acidimicrobiales bacterium]
MTLGWPSALWLVRHGESVGNAAAAEARRRGLEVIDIGPRDADVDLTERGETQAGAVGRWLAALPGDHRPEVALVSPYLRARRTASLALEGLGGTVPVRLDERLRDRELGVLDRLTARGIAVRQPDEAAARRRLGKFYHRPAGGESWADVLLRLRSALTDIRGDHAGRRVLVVAHDVVVVLFRYLLEGLDEARVLEISGQAAPVNCGVTYYQLHEREGLVLRHYNTVIDPDGRLERAEA